jgi:hypothetical protein
MGIYGIQLIEHGGGGVSHWGQVQCANCGAWLKEMPDRYEKKEPLFKGAL